MPELGYGHLRSAAAEHDLNQGRLGELLEHLFERLSAPDYQRAEALLHAMICPITSARLHREQAALPEKANR